MAKPTKASSSSPEETQTPWVIRMPTSDPHSAIIKTYFKNIPSQERSEVIRRLLANQIQFEQTVKDAIDHILEVKTDVLTQRILEHLEQRHIVQPWNIGTNTDAETTYTPEETAKMAEQMFTFNTDDDF